MTRESVPSALPVPNHLIDGSINIQEQKNITVNKPNIEGIFRMMLLCLSSPLRYLSRLNEMMAKMTASVKNR